MQRRLGAASAGLRNDAGPAPTLPPQAAPPSSAATPPSEERPALPETESQPTVSPAALPVVLAHRSLAPVPNLVLDGAAARDTRSAQGQAAREAAKSMAAQGAAPSGPANRAAAHNELPLQAQTKSGEPIPTATPSATLTDPVDVLAASAVGAALPGAQRTADAPLEIVQRTSHTPTTLAASSGTASGTASGLAAATAAGTATEIAAESTANDEARRDTAYVQVQSTLRQGGSTAAGLAPVNLGNPSALPADAFPAAPTIRRQRAVALTERTAKAGQQAGRENMAALPAHTVGSRAGESSTSTATADAGQPGIGYPGIGYPGIGLVQRQTQPAGPAVAALRVSLLQRAHVRAEDEPNRLPVVPVTPVAHFTGNSAGNSAAISTATSTATSAGNSDRLQTDMPLSREPVRRAAAEMGERMAFSSSERGARTLQGYSVPAMAVAAGTGLSEFPAPFLQRQASASTSTTGGSSAAESSEPPAAPSPRAPGAREAQQATLENLDMERVATAVYGIIRDRLIAERENRGL